jgi:OPA family hexose phosphate transport protein UhpT-like MFS transporter
MMADKKLSLFGYTGWEGTFSAIYGSAVVGIAILAFVAFGEERKLRQNRAAGIH